MADSRRTKRLSAVAARATAKRLVAHTRSARVGSPHRRSDRPAAGTRSSPAARRNRRPEQRRRYPPAARSCGGCLAGWRRSGASGHRPPASAPENASHPCHRGAHRRGHLPASRAPDRLDCLLGVPRCDPRLVGRVLGYLEAAGYLGDASLELVHSRTQLGLDAAPRGRHTAASGPRRRGWSAAGRSRRASGV